MDCTICKANKIGPETEPFGGFFCGNKHLQCCQCSVKSMGLCLTCGAATKFMKMKFDSPRPSEAHVSVLPKQISDEIEMESRLSNENLSLDRSEESIKENAHQPHDEGAQVLALAECPCSFINGLNAGEVPEGIKNKNIFLLKSDPSVAIEPAPSSSCKTEQLRCLSTKVLQDFDSENAAFKSEVVNNYLKNCSPTIVYTSPAYNCNDSNCQFSMEQRKQKFELEMKSKSISTDSDPSLKSTYFQMPENNIVKKLNPQDYFILQAMEVTAAAQIPNWTSDKSQNVPIMDMRMRQIFETLKEDIRVNEFAEKSYLTKIPTPAKAPQEKWGERVNCCKEDKNSDLLDQLSNTYRADYNVPLPCVPPANNLYILSKPLSAQQEPPSPQFKRVPCSKAMAPELLLKQADLLTTKTLPANLLNIPRSPILCPESTCQRMIFVSDFCKHLVVDHSHLPVERITPFQCKNFFLDARLFKNGTSKCHLLYLLCDKIIGLGSTEYKDFLPILVMTSRISLHQICDLSNQESSAPDYFLIWVTGIVPEELSISASLTIWSRAGRAPACHIVYSGQMYSIRNSQCALDVWQSGRALLLSSQEITDLTRNGKEMLNLQLSVH